MTKDIASDLAPVDIVKSDFKPLRSICIPVDASQDSVHTCYWALKNIVREGDLVTLVNVRHGAVTNADQWGSAQIDIDNATSTLDKKNLNASKELINFLIARFTAEMVHAEGISIVGDPKHALLKYLEDSNPDMVVIGQRGMGAVSRAFLGSVSDYLVHNAKLPITVVSKK